jgi:Methyltransferase domain
MKSTWQTADRPLVWREEEEILADRAAAVRRRGTIVEIGTALGGTAAIFRRATEGKDVRIFTVDVAPFREAYDRLRGTGVTIVARTSSEFAVAWPREVGRPIDLLYIDGGHDFADVHSDFRLWAPHVRSSGAVVFHDYDPPERGGVAHFGVRVFLDTLLREGALRKATREYKLLSGRLPAGGATTPAIGAYWQTLRAVGDDIVALRDASLRRGPQECIDALKRRSAEMDSLTACYCVERLLRENFELLAGAANDAGLFRRWAEAVSVFDHGGFGSGFPDAVPKTSRPFSPAGFSRLIAREQAKITLLAMVLRTLVPWEV